MEEARNRADRIAADLKQQFSIRSAWRGDALEVSGNGVNGQLLVARTASNLTCGLDSP